MNEKDFWKLISSSVKKADKQDMHPYEVIVNELATRTEEDIFEFERIFRTKLSELYHYNVLMLCEIVNGERKREGFLFFRCFLVLLGKEACDLALEDPDEYNDIVKPGSIYEFEDFISLANDAYAKKTGKQEDESFPAYAIDIVDPDVMEGEEYSSEDLPELCPLLCEKYGIE